MHIPHKRCSFTIFVELVLLQTLVEVWTQLWAEDPNHLVPCHLAEGRSIHGAVGQAQGACVKLSALYVVADPLQNIVCCPTLWVALPVPLTCRDCEREAEIS